MPRSITRAFIGVLALAGATGAAEAATETFPTSVVATGGPVVNADALTDGGTGVATFLRGGAAIFAFDDFVTNQTAIFDVATVNPVQTFVFFRFGRFVNGAFQNALGQGTTDPFGNPSVNDYVEITGPGVFTFQPSGFTDACRDLGGCNAFVFGASNFSATGGGLTVSSLVSSAPEPGAWALMIIAFAGVAWRLKTARGRSPGFAFAPAAA